MEWMILPFRRFAEFGGRSRRKEYWMFTLFSILCSAATLPLDLAMGYTIDDNGPIGVIVSLVFLVPSISVSFRRLHDVDRSAWWLLLAFIPIIGWIILLVWNCTDGTPGPNRFGPDPKNPDGDLTGVFS